MVLEADEDNKPVEFGAIAIHLEHFPEQARALLGEEVPLGTILNEHAIRHESAQAYFKVQSIRSSPKRSVWTPPLVRPV